MLKRLKDWLIKRLARCTNCKAGTRRTEYPATEPFSELEEEKAAYLWNRRFT